MAAVFRHATATLSSATATAPFFSFTPKSSVSWRAWHIAGWKVPFNFLANNSAGEYCGQVFLEVSQTTIAEFQIGNTYQDMRFPSVVIPFGDGISFSGKEQVRVRLVPNDQSIWSSTMFGEE